MTFFVILNVYFGVSLFLYHRTLRFSFRSDEWILYHPFIDLDFSPKSLWKVIAFEMFGDIRFFPLSHILLFLQFKFFGTRTLYYKLVALSLHTINGVMIFTIVTLFGGHHVWAAMAGLLFIALFTHFDTVSWTYHIYHILFSTFGVLLSLLLVGCFTTGLSGAWAFFAAVGVAAVSIFLYEAIVPLPLFIVLYGNMTGLLRWESPLFSFLFSFEAIVLIYGVYGGAYFLFLKREKRIRGSISDYMGFYDVFSFAKFKEGLMSVVHSFRIFGHNSGVSVRPLVRDIVYLPYGLFWPADTIKKSLYLLWVFVIFSSFVHFRISAQTMPFWLVLELVAISSIFIFSLGRNLRYAVTQPRYHYLFNACQVTVFFGSLSYAFEMLPWARFHLLGISLILFMGNAQNVLRANFQISQLLESVNGTVSRLRSFLKQNPGKRVHVANTTTPYGSQGAFFLGSDAALDVIFHEVDFLTPNVGAADYILDDRGFQKNEIKMPPQKAFSLSFAFLLSGNQLTRRQKIFGNRKEGLCIFVDTDFHLSLSDGHINLRTGAAILAGEGWKGIAVEFQNDRVFIVKDQVVSDVFFVPALSGFSMDQRACIGDFYFGPRAPYYLTALHFCEGIARFSIPHSQLGDRLDMPPITETDWWPDEWIWIIDQMKIYWRKGEIDWQKISQIEPEYIYKLASRTEETGSLEEALFYFDLLLKCFGTPSFVNRFFRADLVHLLPKIHYHKARIYGRMAEESGRTKDWVAALFHDLFCLARVPTHGAALNHFFDRCASGQFSPVMCIEVALMQLPPGDRHRVDHFKHLAAVFDGVDACAERAFLSCLSAVKSSFLKANGFHFLYKTASLFESNGRYALSSFIFNGILEQLDACSWFQSKREMMSEVYFHLGQIDRMQDLFEPAKYNFERCLEFNPEHRHSREYLLDLQGRN